MFFFFYRSIINQQSICPFKYIVNKRENKYPFYRVQVKCTCDKCTLTKSKFIQNFYSCQPVVKYVPVLIREENKCDSDGFYRWLPSTEIVNLACVCATNGRWFPYL